MGRLDETDLSLTLDKAEGERRLAEEQRRLLALRLQLGGLIGDGWLGPPLLVLFEGWDASGKGGAIRRLVTPLDPRHVRVVQFAAPSADEKRHHFLQRFWPPLPGWGGMAVFDRSYYGRVLVERVEGFADEAEWRRGYDEIAAFEQMLHVEGTTIVKFWLQISDEEQKQRFEKRAQDPLKQWKLTDEDWRNREKRPQYEEALEELFARTDRPAAPWTVVPAESKAYARVAVLETVNAAIVRALRAHGREPISFPAREGK
ncbi:UDP-galactose-lipid carrier transferase [Conexibacter sp. JD483]|uniref:polyphosphate kinase 2 family protein n=1 Tax=unclassified Conexibacter TaxID=2627773 RepID=UPI0027237E32|nr:MULTISPECIES: UDP-galactose-lipid carrier transferase [unclassified Conexibacter]MDO8184937.1 UDP-galactose-lipid carrier transferase [Conexibacter sp. CPCC 205706]MDO8198081.1 UDP-galactose-lipid carrier transferase [Conexibacter sp. CPCC 205762]MDR9368297.1 UDP-galactose-lipid carrier transferase [Conexibacter sp. JD483]